MAAAASSAETSARWSPSPVNGSRNPAASPTSSQPGPARRVTRCADRPCAGDLVERRVGGARSAGSSGRWRDRGHDRRGDRPRPVPGDRPATERPQHDPDVHPPARHRRDPDVAVADQAHPRVASRPSGRRRGDRSARAARDRPAGRATPAARATTERGPSAPTMTARAESRGPLLRRGRAGRPVSRSTAVTAQPRRTSAPAARASSSRAGSSARPVEPDAGGRRSAP